jgi:iron complex outermembrane receptor protein
LKSIAILSALLFASFCAGAEDQTPNKHLETVVVTGTPQAVPLEEADRSVTALDTREASQLFESWAGYLQLDPSVDLQQRAPNGLQGDLSIRGSSFGQTLVLVNGFRVNDAQTGHYNLDLPFPMDALQQIEVLHGAGSTLYGSDALGGAVNFIAVPPAFSEFRLDAAYGSFGTNEQNTSAAYVSKRLSQQLSFARSLSTGFAPDRDYRSLALSSNTHATSQLGDTGILLGYSDRPYGADQFYGNYNSWERTKAWFASLKQEIGDSTEFDLGYRRHTDNFILLRDRPSYYANNHETESWQAAVRRRQSLAKQATLFYGAEGYRDSIASSNLGKHARNHGAAYADMDLRALHRFSLSAGLREELYGDYRSELSPSLSAGVWLLPQLKLHASASHAFRLPTYTELYYKDPATAGNSDLRPESAWSYESGLDWHATDKLSSSVTVFHRRERNDIDYVRYSSADKWHAMNLQRLNFTGAEASVRLRLVHAQELQLAYTGIRGVQESLAFVSRYTGTYPTHSGVVSWQGVLPGKFTCRTRIGVTDRKWESTYAIWDFAASREFGSLTPYVRLSSLADTSYQEIRGVAMPGRSIMVGLRYVMKGKKT